LFLEVSPAQIPANFRTATIYVFATIQHHFVKSKLADVQMKLQENLREVQVRSCGGDIRCTLPPALGAVSASLDPIGNASFAEGVCFEVCA